MVSIKMPRLLYQYGAVIPKFRSANENRSDALRRRMENGKVGEALYALSDRLTWLGMLERKNGRTDVDRR